MKQKKTIAKALTIVMNIYTEFAILPVAQYRQYTHQAIDFFSIDCALITSDSNFDRVMGSPINNIRVVPRFT